MIRENTIPMSRRPEAHGAARAAFRRGALLLLFFCACLDGGFASCHAAGEPSSFQLRPAVQVDGSGVILNQVVQADPAVPALRLCDAPAFGKTTLLNRATVNELAQAAGCPFALTNWTGAAAVRIGRRARTLAEGEALQLLTATLQEQCLKDKGELELRLARPWTPLNVPDEPLTLKILDLPTAGVSSSFIARCELQTAGGEHLAPWQAALQARLWREIWVARAALKRGDLLAHANLLRERRDLLLLRETPAELDPQDSTLELAEPIPAGAPLLARALKVRPVVHRGQSIAALVQDGALLITLKVEAMEDGAPGQLIRVRNPLSRRDLRGKVLDEQSVLVTL